MGLEEKLPSGFLLTTVEQAAGWVRKSSVFPATFGLACCAIEMMTTAPAATTWPASAWRCSAVRPARRT